MAITEVKALDFEQSLAPLAKELTTLEKQAAEESSPEAQENVEGARLALLERLEALYAELTPWQTVQVARHPERPHADDLVSAICGEFVEFAGDRLYADDPAIMGGLARLDDRVVMVLGHRKGHDTRENVTRNYGMPHPEGYRKARRLMLQAEKFDVPLVCLLDTPAAQASLRSCSEASEPFASSRSSSISRLRGPALSCSSASSRSSCPASSSRLRIWSR